MNNTKQKGFTLIELLIVIGIIAILAAAVIIAINPGRQFQQAREATRWSHVNSVANAVYSYAIDNGGNFPDCNGVTDTLTPLGDLAAFEDVGTARDVTECTTDLVDTYMAALPNDPQTAADTGYKITSDGTRIKIMSASSESSVEIVQ